MTSIRIKVKNLIKALLIMASMSLILYSVMPSIMMKLADMQMQKGNRPAAHVYYQRIIRYFPKNGTAAMAMEWLAQGLEVDNYLMISPVGFGGSSSYGEEMGIISEETLQLYEKLVQLHPDTPHGHRAMIKLAIRDIYHALKEDSYNKVQKVIDDLEERTLPRSAYELQRVYLFTIKELSSRGYFNKAVDFGEKYIQSIEADKSLYYYDERIFETLGDAYLMMGEGERAKEIYRGLIDNIRSNQLERLKYNEDDEIIHYSNIYDEERIANLERKIATVMESGANSGRISGNVTLNGEALGETSVFLQPLTGNGGFPMADNRALWLRSNEKGEFTFNNVPTGRYGLGLVVDLNIIGDSVLKEGRFPNSTIDVEAGGSYHWSFDFVETLKVNSPVNDAVINSDEIHFSWEPVEGAAYYTLELGRYFGGASSTRPLPEKYYDTTAEQAANILLQLDGSLSFDDNGVVPMSFMNYPYPNSKHFWGVVAYDYNDNILTSTLGYVRGQNTDFTFKGQQMRQGDKYLEAGDYKRTIEAYEGDLDKNSEDIYALIMLARLYKTNEVDIYPHTNLPRAKELLQRLYDITDDEIFLLQYNSIDETKRP